MFKKFAVVTLILGLLAISATATFAQGGNGNGRGAGGAGTSPGTTTNPTPGTCIDEPQLNAYNNGGIGFVNPQTGSAWNGQQRGQMGRGTVQNGTGFYSSLPPVSASTLPQAVVNLMIEGWTDEQHAYAIYEAVMEQFGEIAPFASIRQAEAQHIAAWEFLFDRYGIAVPAVPAFETPVFASLAEACTLSADAESSNFVLYNTMLVAFSDYPDIYQVALSLRNASEFQHLPAFQACAG